MQMRHARRRCVVIDFVIQRRADRSICAPQGVSVSAVWFGEYLFNGRARASTKPPCCSAGKPHRPTQQTHTHMRTQGLDCVTADKKRYHHHHHHYGRSSFVIDSSQPCTGLYRFHCMTVLGLYTAIDYKKFITLAFYFDFLWDRLSWPLVSFELTLIYSIYRLNITSYHPMITTICLSVSKLCT